MSCEEHSFLEPYSNGNTKYPELKAVISSPTRVINGTVYLSPWEILHSKNKMPYKITGFYRRILELGGGHALVYYKIYTTASNYTTTLQYIFDNKDPNYMGTIWGDVSLDFDVNANKNNTISDIRNYVEDCYSKFHGTKPSIQEQEERPEEQTLEQQKEPDELELEEEKTVSKKCEQMVEYADYV